MLNSCLFQDHLGAAVVFSAAVCTVTMASHGYINSGMVGLGIAYALMVRFQY